MSALYAAADRYRAAVLRREQEAAARLARTYGAVWTSLQRELEALEQAYRLAVRQPGFSPLMWAAQFGRAEALRAQAASALARWTEAATETVEASLLASVDAAQRDAAGLAELAGVQTRFDRLPQTAINELVGLTADGSPLADLLARLPGDTGQRVYDALLDGLALGRGPRQTARAMRETLGMGLSRALTIARTETLRAYREATRATWRTGEGVVGWRWLSARQPRTCAACWAMDGRTFPLDTPMPAHPNCRCVMVPVLEGEDTPAHDSDGALRAAPVATQRAVLGKRWQAWQAGEFGLSDLVRTTRSAAWGETINTR